MDCVFGGCQSPQCLPCSLNRVVNNNIINNTNYISLPSLPALYEPDSQVGMFIFNNEKEKPKEQC